MSARMIIIISKILDWIKFKLNTFPKPDYQPIPWLGIERARRSDGVQSRWKIIEQIVEELNVTTAIDIGCNSGYFPIALALKEIKTIGVESDSKYYDTMTYVVRHLKLKNVGMLQWEIGVENCELLPTADCIIFLAVWHHIVKFKGIEAASNMLSKLWNKTGKVLFFETGELEMPTSYKLPRMEPTPQKFLEVYLMKQCANAKIKHLGLHDAFAPDGQKVLRNLFAVIRK